jgi:hypothetical protein
MSALPRRFVVGRADSPVDFPSRGRAAFGAEALRERRRGSQVSNGAEDRVDRYPEFCMRFDRRKVPLVGERAIVESGERTGSRGAVHAVRK